MRHQGQGGAVNLRREEVSCVIGCCRLRIKLLQRQANDGVSEVPKRLLSDSVKANCAGLSSDLIERAAISTRGDVIRAEHLSIHGEGTSRSECLPPLE